MAGSGMLSLKTIRCNIGLFVWKARTYFLYMFSVSLDIKNNILNLSMPHCAMHNTKLVQQKKNK